MSEKILVLGESGCGKSRSIKNLDPKTTFLINVIGKQLPIKGWKGNYKDKENMIKTCKSAEIIKAMRFVSEKKPEIKTIVVDDSQYVMSFEFMQRASERGFDKFTEIAKNMFDVFLAPDSLRDDLVVVFLSHSEDVNLNGATKTKIKTIGKMLDDKITIEGLFTIVLLTDVFKTKDNKLAYRFVTRNSGSNTVKTPEGMFTEDLIENDLNLVLETMHKYYEGE